MRLYEIIRAAGGGASVEELATQAGVGRDRAEGALRTLLPALGRAIQRAGERPTGAATIHAAMQDERYARYLEHPATLREARAAADGERVLEEILDAGQRDQLVRNAAAAIQADDASVRRLLPLIAALAMGALGRWVTSYRLGGTDVPLPVATDPASTFPTGLEETYDGITPLRTPTVIACATP